jgi:4-hydroxybenzoate polyprenyltransferase
MRIFAGYVVIERGFSPWLLLFAFFLFLSLAIVKRYSELKASTGELAGRGYSQRDDVFLAIAGQTSAIIACMVLCLYIASRSVSRLYPDRYYLWLIVPLFVYWVLRVWLLGHRGEMNEDPVVFTLKDPVSYALAGCCVIIVLFAL